METPYINRFKQNSLPKSEDKKPLIVTLILGAILIAVFFSQSAVSDYMERSDTIAAAQTKLQGLQQDLQKLQEVETNLKKPEIAGDIKRYATTFREDDILESLFTNTAGVAIQSVSIDKGQKTTNGLSLANIQLSVTVNSKDQLVSFLDYLTSAANSKRYIIKSLDYPYDITTSAGSANISLGMYYYE